MPHRTAPGSQARRVTTTTARPRRFSERRFVRSSSAPGTTSTPGTTSSAAAQPMVEAFALPVTGNDRSVAASVRPNTNKFFCVLCTIMSSASGEPVQ